MGSSVGRVTLRILMRSLDVEAVIVGLEKGGSEEQGWLG